MKYFLIFLYIIFAPFIVQAQSLEQKVAAEVCKCLGEVDEKEEVEGKMNRCFPISLDKVLELGTDEEKGRLLTLGDIKEAIFKARILLEEDCPIVRVGALKRKKNKHYIPSSSQKANGYYLEGIQLLEQHSFLKAASKFKKSVKADEGFVLAMDQLAMTFRQLEKWEEVINWSERSLAIFPEGDVALLNVAVACSFVKDTVNAMEYYKKLNFLYPENADGYYGIASLCLSTGDYELALDNILLAHKLFSHEGSAHTKESAELIHLLYYRFSELNKADYFFLKTEKHGVELSLNEK